MIRDLDRLLQDRHPLQVRLQTASGLFRQLPEPRHQAPVSRADHGPGSMLPCDLCGPHNTQVLPELLCPVEQGVGKTMQELLHSAGSQEPGPLQADPACGDDIRFFRLRSRLVFCGIF